MTKFRASNSIYSTIDDCALLARYSSPLNLRREMFTEDLHDAPVVLMYPLLSSKLLQRTSYRVFDRL
jgi:hypothetical protein